MPSTLEARRRVPISGTLYRNSLLVFVRSKNLMIPYLVLLSSFIALFAFCFSNYLQWGDIFAAMTWLVRPTIFVIAFFIFCGYEIAVKVHENSVAEYAGSYGQGLWRALTAIMLSLLTVVAIPSLMFSGFTLFLYRYAGYQYLPLLNHLSKLCMLYFGLFFLVGAMLGAAMAARFKTNRLAAYSLTVAFVLLNTTFTDVPFRIPYLLFNSYKIERLLYSIKDFVTVVPYELGSSFRVYPIYGFPMEPIRWILGVFWIGFLLIAVLTECFTPRVAKKLRLTGGLVTLTCLLLFMQRGSMLHMDNRSDSYPYADPNYYMGISKQREDYETEPARFGVKAYEMDLTIGNELHAEVEVTVDNPYLDNYEFTLYHGYTIKSVHASDREIPFIREGDYVRVGALDKTDKLVFLYSGKSPKYYANKQAIALPGYFAYYPKPGRSEMFDLDVYGYVINAPPSVSDYTVGVDSDLKVFSNLALTDGVFHGRSNGISLFAGMYDQVGENIYGEVIREDLPKRESILEAEKVLEEVLARLHHPEMMIPISDLKAFQVPSSFFLNSNTEDVVVMADHLTTTLGADGTELAQEILESYMKFTSSNRLAEFLFRQNYLNYLMDDRHEATPTHQDRVDPTTLLETIEELRLLVQKHSSIDSQEYDNMNDVETKSYIDDRMRISELIPTVGEGAAKYLFRESPRKEEHFRTFFENFVSDDPEDCLRLVESILREELGA